MPWSYSGDPSKSAKDTVRFLIGDTDKDDQLLQDGEIAYLLGLHNNAPLNAAIKACDAITAKYARLSDEAQGQYKNTLSQKMKGIQSVAAMLRRRLAIEGTQSWAGGISKSDKQANTDNSDRVEPKFRKDIMEDQLTSPLVSESETLDPWS